MALPLLCIPPHSYLHHHTRCTSHPPTSQELLYNVQEQPAAGVHPRHICLELDPETQVGGSVTLLLLSYLQ